MDEKARLAFLQDAYAGVLVDSVRHLGLAGVLESVTARKRAEQGAGGKRMADRLGCATPAEVFRKVSDVFACAVWVLEPDGNGVRATAKTCKLCALARRFNTEKPCEIYCLNPLEGMIRGVDPGSDFRVESTLWEGAECRVRVGRIEEETA